LAARKSAQSAAAREHEQSPDVGPASGIPALSEQEVAVLREVGGEWGRALGGGRAWLRALPVDPALHRFPSSLAPGRKRFAAVDFVEVEGDGGGGDEGGGGGGGEELPGAGESSPELSRAARALASARRLLLGAPLASSAVAFERMRKLVALPILSSDALSSVAYGPEAMLTVLALAGSGALGLSLSISAVIVVLMIAVGLSYRQIIKAYPHGGGSYVVAGANLGQFPALIAAAGLLIDYVLTVAVSISSGVAAITSALPSLVAATVPIGLGVIAVLLVGNLRGVREAGAVFSAPTYAFVVAMFLLVIVGVSDAAARGFKPVHVSGLHPVQAITALLVLRAFSSGATAMTGIEAISNAVPAFEPPGWRNARTVLAVMVSLLVVMFAGLVLVIHFEGVVPRSGETVLSALAHRAFGAGPLYIFVQATTALVLLLAANTAFNGFPRLLSFMAHKGHAPRAFLRLGDRLAFSNGIVVLAVGAALLFTVFDGKTDALIPLYAVGVFVAFTFSQTGMVVHWWRRRGAHWRKGLALNATGALLSGVVFVIAAVTKFAEGAWVALLLIALLVLLTWRIRVHYLRVHAALALRPLEHSKHHRIVPSASAKADTSIGADGGAAFGAERDATPDQLSHLAIVPVAHLDLASLRALAYAASLGQPVLAIHISPSQEEGERFRGYWDAWGDHLPLAVVDSPYRALVEPMARYIDALRGQRPDITVSVVLPELIVKHRWHRPLHNGSGRRLQRALRRRSGIVTTIVPFHLPT
jgi:amino acid transporter